MQSEVFYFAFLSTIFHFTSPHNIWLSLEVFSIWKYRNQNWRVPLFIYLFLISWRLITLQYCSGFCHTLTRISLGYTCIPHPDPPTHLESTFKIIWKNICAIWSEYPQYSIATSGYLVYIWVLQGQEAHWLQKNTFLPLIR